jgi:hypothetical protein
VWNDHRDIVCVNVALFCWPSHAHNPPPVQEDYAEFLADALPLHLFHVINVKMDS